MLEIPRCRNLETPTGAEYETAFCKTELLDRGWTHSMIKRHLGPPDDVLRISYAKYQYDRRRVYAAEATPSVQFDLLATADVRFCGPTWLRQLAAYVPNIMRASLQTRAENSTDPGQAARLRQLAANLPPAKALNTRQSAAPVAMPPPPGRYPTKPP